MNSETLVINYHRIDEQESAACTGIDDLFTISAKMFRDQMLYLHQNNIPVISLSDLATGRVPPGFSVALTFDDGNHSDVSIAFPLLKELKYPATFFWCTDKLNQLDSVREMLRNGMSIGSHGVSHLDLTSLSEKERLKELVNSKSILESKINKVVDFFAFPYGQYNSKAIRLAERAGYSVVLTTDGLINNIDSSVNVIHRWSVKHSTTIAKFSRMMKKSSIFRIHRVVRVLKRTIKNIIGRKLSDEINILMHNKVLKFR